MWTRYNSSWLLKFNIAPVFRIFYDKVVGCDVKLEKVEWTIYEHFDIDVGISISLFKLVFSSGNDDYVVVLR